MIRYYCMTYDQGRRNSIISGEATSNIANFFALFPQKLVCQPLISGEAGASLASPVPTPLSINNFKAEIFPSNAERALFF